MRQLATIQKIAEVLPIEGADKIEKVRVKDWWCVAVKGEFKVNDPCVYFEIDSLLPLDNPAFEFLSKGSKPKKVEIDGKEYTGYRLKTVKLRGQISQGLAFPLKDLTLYSSVPLSEVDVGDDVTEALGVVKWERPIPAQLTGKVKGQRPGFIPKTDEERIQNCGHLLAKHFATLFYITEKLDGSSATFFRHTTTADGDHFGVCSRNLELLETEGNSFWDMAKKYDLPNKLPSGFVLQGELIGEGVQGNPLKLKGRDIRAYNVFDINNSKYLDYPDFVKFCADLGVPTVPILSEDSTLPATVEELLKQADGKSAISPECAREGIVVRPMTEMQDEINGTTQRLSFKAVSNEYLLKSDA